MRLYGEWVILQIQITLYHLKFRRPEPDREQEEEEQIQLLIDCLLKAISKQDTKL
jgi:hypothetical protein